LFIPIYINAEAISVGSFDELKTAISNGETEITITNDMEFNDLITISNKVTIEGNDHHIDRESSYLGGLFKITNIGNITLNNIKVDLKAPGWYMDYENRKYTGSNNTGYVRVPLKTAEGDVTASSSLIQNAGKLFINNSDFKNGKSTVQGTIINGNGDNEIKNTRIEHMFSSQRGASFYVSGGTSVFDNIYVKESCSGTASNGSTSGFLNITNSNLEMKNSTFENNFSQNDGGVAYISGTNTLIDNCTFKGNSVGNDGSVFEIKSTVVDKTFEVINSTFEDNAGYALTGQSMGMIWLTGWLSTEENPIVFRNDKFKNNTNKLGGVIADMDSQATHVLFDNVEVYGVDNNEQYGSLLYSQNSNYVVKNSIIHDNNVYVGQIYINYGNVKLQNVEIYNNKSKYFGAIYHYAGTLNIEDSIIKNNKGTAGAGIYITSNYNNYPPIVELKNTTITENEGTAGSGIYITEKNLSYVSLTMDENTKIYNNKSNVYAEDILLTSIVTEDNNTDNTIHLNNPGNYGIPGIDGWYIDIKDDRFVTSENPQKYENYDIKTKKGVKIYIKAAGVSSLEFELEGGTNAEIETIPIKYGVENDIPEIKPEKEGYIFLSWNTKANGSGTTVEPGSKYDGSDGLTLYAQYLDDKNKNNIDDRTEPHFSVTFSAGKDGELLGKDKYDNILTGLTFEDAMIVIPEVKANRNYKFVKWDVEPSGIIENDLIYTAVYEEIGEKVPKTIDELSQWIMVSIISYMCMILSIEAFKRIP
jgi:hypothetical protein